MRDAFALGAAASYIGLPGTPAPVRGFDAQHRAVQQHRLAVGAAHALRAQRTTFGRGRRVGDADVSGGVAARVRGRRRVGERAAPFADVDLVDVVGAVAAAHVEVAVGTEREVPDRVARELLTPLPRDQRGDRTGAALRVHGDAHELTGDDAPVDVVARRARAAVVPRRRAAARRRVEREKRVDEVVTMRTEPRIDRESEQAAVGVVVGTARGRSAKRVGVASCKLANTSMMPLFSATKTRPSGAKAIAVGTLRPWKTTVSWNPAGRPDDARVVALDGADTTNRPAVSAATATSASFVRNPTRSMVRTVTKARVPCTRSERDEAPPLGRGLAEDVESS